MDNKEMIAFGKEQLEIFGEGSKMHEFIKSGRSGDNGKG